MDRLIKDILTESESLDIEHFIPLLQERVYVLNPYCRQFLIAWVMVLDSVPNINLLHYLPKFLDGLFNMLKDTTKDIRLEAETCLGEFLNEIKTVKNVDFASMVHVLLTHCSSKGSSKSIIVHVTIDEFTRLTALEWIYEFVETGKEALLPYSAQLLSVVLPNLSQGVPAIEDIAKKANNSLNELILTTKSPIPMGEILKNVTLQFLNQYVRGMLQRDLISRFQHDSRH